VLGIQNETGEFGAVEIYAIGDAGRCSCPASFTLNASAAVEFTATDRSSGRGRQVDLQAVVLYNLF